MRERGMQRKRRGKSAREQGESESESARESESESESERETCVHNLNFVLAFESVRAHVTLEPVEQLSVPTASS
jgi:hypothetical protein